MKQSISILILLLCLNIGAVAQRPQRVQATREPIVFVQPDGDTLIIRLHGDEWKHFRTTADGYLIAKNKRGYYCYAKRNRQGNIRPTCHKAHNEKHRTEKEKAYIRKNIYNHMQQH